MTKPSRVSLRLPRSVVIEDVLLRETEFVLKRSWWSIAALLVFSSTRFGHAQTSSETLTVISPRGQETLTVARFVNASMVRLDEVAALVGATVRTEPGSGTALFILGDRSAAVSSGRSLVPVGQKLILLPSPATAQGGSLWVPVDFLGKILPELLPQKVTYRPDARLLILGEGFPRVGVRTFAYPSYTRIVIEPSQSVPYQVSQGEGRVTVLLQAAYLDTDFQQEELRDGVVERLSMTRRKEGYALDVRLGQRFASLKAFELEGPHRLVLDFVRNPLPAGAESRGSSVTPPGGPVGPIGDDGRLTPPRGPDRARPLLRTLTIDPGHGGGENGAKGAGGLLEKDVTLALAKRLAKELEGELGLHVLLTRDGDQNLGLDERTALANQNKSDLFLSIHLNASPRGPARGPETYFLSYEASDDESRRLALAENASMPRRAASVGTDQSLDFILWDMAQAAFLNESAALAEILQEELTGATDGQNRGIKQAPFRVLMGAAMPAVLVEVGFITNSEEEQLLASAAHQEKLVKDIYRAIVRYKERFERAGGGTGDPARDAQVSQVSRLNGTAR